MRIMILFALLAGFALPAPLPVHASGSPAVERGVDADAERPASLRAKPQGATGEALAEAKGKGSETSGYETWKRRLPFWPRKGAMLLELLLLIVAGVLVGQILEVSGCVRALSVVTLPLTWLGRLPRAAGPSFLMAFQSGAVANSMLVAQRDGGNLNNRELYTSVYVVSALSLFAHLPTFVLPIGAAFGLEATVALFAVRFAAIALQVTATLLISGLVVSRFTDGAPRLATPGAACTVTPGRRGTGPFWSRVWRNSRRTLLRLVTYLIPTFVVMASVEYYGGFTWLADRMPGLFTLPFLPPESVVIIPAQALSLYNGAIAAANFIDSGAMSVRQAVIVILFGSIITAPVRTLKHALPTYVAILGARAGLFMAVSAQVLRMLFLLLCTALLMLMWI